MLNTPQPECGMNVQEQEFSEKLLRIEKQLVETGFRLRDISLKIDGQATDLPSYTSAENHFAELEVLDMNVGYVLFMAEMIEKKLR